MEDKKILKVNDFIKNVLLWFCLYFDAIKSTFLYWAKFENLEQQRKEVFYEVWDVFLRWLAQK